MLCILMNYCRTYNSPTHHSGLCNTPKMVNEEVKENIWFVGFTEVSP